MINEYFLNKKDLCVESDVSGEFPIYIYISDDEEKCLFSDSITELLNDSRVSKPLALSDEAISFFLQSGVVPQPKTIYENIYIISNTLSASLKTHNKKIQISFNERIVLSNKSRILKDDFVVDEKEILSMLSEATTKKLKKGTPSFLFHSAGKDSNSIALALAEAGLQNEITLVTHKSKGACDESEISKRIAKKLGFKHRLLHEVSFFKDEHLKFINQYFENSPFPCSDNVTLAYPLYAYQVPEFQEANIIDGMGNDLYIGHIPGNSEFKRQQFFWFLKKFRGLFKNFASDSLLYSLTRSRCEHTGITGFSYGDTKIFFPNAIDVFPYWSSKDQGGDYLDFRSLIRGGILDQEVFMRKVRNFSDSVRGNVVFPWADPIVAKYFSEIPESYLFDRKKLKNKLILREILKNRLDLDSDKVGKMAFSYDSNEVVLNNWLIISEEIKQCGLWSTSDIMQIMNVFLNKMQLGKRYSVFLGRLIYRVYLLSAWYNKNKYSN